MRWAALPLAGWMLWFLMLPIGILVVYSFFQRGAYGEVVTSFSLKNYLRLSDPLYLGIYWKSLKFALFTSLGCLALGFPMAYAMATARAKLRPLLLVLLMIPFLSNFVVRVYAIRTLLGASGPLSQILVVLGVYHEPTSLNDSELAVAIGMLTNYLPFMVLPIYVVLDKFDFSLLDAARDLGASAFHVASRILLPLSRRGVAAGTVLVFVPTLGEFLIPDLLGGARTMLLGNLITDQFLKARDWPFGAALTLMLIAVMAIGLFLQTRASR